MMDFLAWLEQTQFSIWVRETDSVLGYPTFLFVHTLGLSMVAGGSAVINLALLGLWPETAIKPLERLYPVIWVGFSINAITGVALLMMQATAMSTNLAFYVKMLFVFTGVALLSVMRKRVFGDPALGQAPLPGTAKLLAWASLVCWFGAITAGRLLAYVGTR